LRTAQITEGVCIRLEKRIPLAAGLGGGSGNAAITLRALNELFGRPFSGEQLHALAAQLGSDVPFFLQDKPALATGRGECITALEPLPALREACVVLLHPGFGISTAWAYQQLAKFPAALHGRPGRAKELVGLLQETDLAAAGPAFYNALEAPALNKYPILALYQEFLRDQAATATLMSGSGSTTFALFSRHADAATALDRLKAKFGDRGWTALVML
jgi:4-diphosphocytidyl-2-C-methyl-D-erythritol kinase